MEPDAREQTTRRHAFPECTGKTEVDDELELDLDLGCRDERKLGAHRRIPSAENAGQSRVGSVVFVEGRRAVRTRRRSGVFAVAVESHDLRPSDCPDAPVVSSRGMTR